MDLVNLKSISSEKEKNLVFMWRNQEHIRKVMFHSEIILWEDHLNWLSKINNTTNIVKIFYYKGTPMGVVNFKLINEGEKIFEWGFYIGDKRAPKGAGTIMGYTALNFIKRNHCAKKVLGDVIEFNKISCAYHEKLGFQMVKVLSNKYERNGVFYDVYKYILDLDKVEVIDDLW